MPHSETYTPQNFSSIGWSDDLTFKYCDFKDLGHEDGQIEIMIDGDYIHCKFENLYWYWDLANSANFINSRFSNCTFAGCNFFGCRFVDCVFENCKFIKDNLDGQCRFDDSVAYSWTITECPGFAIKRVG